MNASMVPVVPDGRANGRDPKRFEQLRHEIEHAAHLLPAQGPITVFVHHNTLHAFEDMQFEDAVVHGASVFGCHPYLPEARYREEFDRGRILPEDIEAALIQDLGEDADVLLGFLGTRFQLRKLMLEHPLLTGPTAELRWFVAETDALSRFRAEAQAPVRDRLIQETRRWILRDFRNRPATPSTDEGRRIRAYVDAVIELLDDPRVEQWDMATWEAFSLNLLWLVCRDGASKVPAKTQSRAPWVRHRDWLLQATGEDSDILVQNVLIPFCAAFLDQGMATWSLPHRDAGLFAAFLATAGRPFGPPDRWLRPLGRELARYRELGIAPLPSIQESLEALGISRVEEEEYITQSLLALRGFAGMIWQVETRGDRIARPVPEGSLIEFLAVQLLLERFATAHVARETLGYRGPLSELRDAVRRNVRQHDSASVDQRAFLMFQIAQLSGWKPELLYQLSAADWTALIHEIEDFSALDRRRVYHLAYERRYRVQALDAISIHARRVHHQATTRNTPPSFQVVCCIDDREESFRRHLEEIAPDCETFGAAGFFAVAMYYRGSADAHYTPLCPVIIRPQHYVNEDVAYTFERADRRRRQHRRTLGTMTHRVHLGSRTFAGGWLTAVFGSLASFPIVMRILFPRATAQVRKLIGEFVRPPATTQLHLERTKDPAGPDNGHVGYRLEEMAGVVERLLRDIGLISDFSRLIIVTGHGSSSLNNPHESAYNCGACAGARGGPNARAFANMANDARVRALLQARGFHIPSETYFVGAYHNTCDDSVIYFDLDRLPASHRDDFEAAEMSIQEARARNSHERCRRFESAELSQSPANALRHVEGRAEDLSQARPEYNHATNAMCLVGRREWSRGLYLDRRAFLQSYDSAQDDGDYTILTRILQAVIPVCAGISLEYYFSCVDPIGWGAGNKLPHNITSLLGVMDGAASDLRPGLYQQMVEIHEPMRLLFVIEATPAAIEQIMERNEGIARLVRGHWVQLATLNASTGEINVFGDSQFEPYLRHSHEIPKAESSEAWYRGWRDHLSFASIVPEKQRSTAESHQAGSHTHLRATSLVSIEE